MCLTLWNLWPVSCFADIVFWGDVRRYQMNAESNEINFSPEENKSILKSKNEQEIFLFFPVVLNSSLNINVSSDL